MRKIALVAGAKGDIGSSITNVLINEGYRVIAIYSPGNEICAVEWFEQNRYSDDNVRLLSLDVTNTYFCKEVLECLLREEEYIDVLVNNAGITRDSTFNLMMADQWNDVINSNLNDLFNVIQPLFSAMCERGSARIINISSVNGLKGQFELTNYSAIKAGMIRITKALVAEGVSFGITVNVVAPGNTGTAMVKAIQPEAIDRIKA